MKISSIHAHIELPSIVNFKLFILQEQNSQFVVPDGNSCASRFLKAIADVDVEQERNTDVIRQTYGR